MAKILIEIPDNVDYRNYDMPYFVLDAIQKGKRIPDNATNGDVVQSVFPEILIIEPKTVGYDESHKHNVVRVETEKFHYIFPSEWWNAPYKENKDAKN